MKQAMGYKLSPQGYSKGGGSLSVNVKVTRARSARLKDDRHRDSALMESILRERLQEKQTVLDQMMSYYNKGLRAMDNDPFNAFLSFWGCLETYIRDEIKRHLHESDFVRFLQGLNVGKEEAKELYEKYRCAVAHASYDPSAPDEVGSLAAKIPWIRELAKRFISKQLIDQ
jgi:hypothetical protein